MEEAVWVAFGVISVAIAFSIIIGLIDTTNEDKKELEFENSLKELREQCNFVCESPKDTLLSIDVDLPSGLYLYTTKNKICGKFKKEVKCEVCGCNVTMDKGNLSLNTSIAEEFDLHTYKCFFEKVNDGKTDMECKG